MANTTIARLSSWCLDSCSAILRLPARPLPLRNWDFEDVFDFTTVFYDCFWDRCGQKIILVGPPLLNLEDDLSIKIRAVPSLQECAFSTRKLHQVSTTFVQVAQGTTSLILESRAGSIHIAPQPNLSYLFKDRRVLFTLSKDNEPQWIKDWAQYHVRQHGCDAILFYDNASDTYESADISEILTSVAGLKVAVVVPWPFPYGPFDSRVELSYWIWDAQYCQPGCFEHARRRLLSTARSVLNTDIDELVLTADGRPVFEIVENSGTGYVEFSGLWVEDVAPEPRDPADGPPRHKDFYYVRKRRTDLCEPKWAIIPGRCPDWGQWHTHIVHGMLVDNSSVDAQLRHFKAINTNWSVDRAQSIKLRTESGLPNSEALGIDSLLRGELAEAFSAR